MAQTNDCRQFCSPKASTKLSVLRSFSEEGLYPTSLINELRRVLDFATPSVGKIGTESGLLVLRINIKKPRLSRGFLQLLFSSQLIIFYNRWESKSTFGN